MRTIHTIQVNGTPQIIHVMVEEFKFGKTKVNFVGILRTIQQMGEVNQNIKMEIITKETGKMIKSKEKEHFSMKMGQSIQEIGKMINKMEEEQKVGLMELYIMVNIKKVLNQAKVNLNGRMGLNIKDILRIIVLMVKEYLYGKIKEFMMVIG